MFILSYKQRAIGLSGLRGFCTLIEYKWCSSPIQMKAENNYLLIVGLGLLDTKIFLMQCQWEDFFFSSTAWLYTAISINSGRLGLQKPDLVLCSDNQAFVIDISIVSDQVSVDQAHRQKVEYYIQSHISEWVSRVTGATDVGYLWDIGEALCPSSVRHFWLVMWIRGDTIPCTK